MPLLSEILEANSSQARKSNKGNRKKRSSSKNNNWKTSRVECHADNNAYKKVAFIGPYIFHRPYEIFLMKTT